MIVALGLLAVAVGTVVFHFMSPWWWTPIASNWGYIDDTIILTFWITGAVFVAVVVFTAYCVLRFKYRPEARSEYRPENHKLEWWLTGLTSVGVAAMLIPGLFVWHQYVTVPDDATEVEVLAKQWSWGFRLPGKDGKLGTSNVRLINDDNPFGVDPKDKNGQDDVLIDGDNLHLPLNKPVKILIRSIDVLHDFYVPEFRAKMDSVPGSVTYFWVEPTRAGTFDILCFELCGVGHHAMRSQVVVESAAAYDKWLSEQTTFKQAAAAAKAKKSLAATAASGDDAKKLVSRGESTEISKTKAVR
jgi:cytochrome c oxidase subunit 2